MGIFTPQHTSVYDQLLALGYTDEAIRNEAQAHRGGTRSFTVVTADTPDGTPIVGLSYAGDFRYEEEAGVGDLMKALTGGTMREYAMDKGASAHVASFTDVNGLVLSVEPLVSDELAWGDVVLEKSSWKSEGYPASGTQEGRDGAKAEYVSHWDYSVSYMQGSEGRKLAYKSATEIKAVAKSLGMTGLSKLKKDQVLAALLVHPDLPRETPNVWPGYFHYGKTLILRAEDGLAADVLRILIACAKEGKLALGGGRQVFGTGLGLYDSRDEGPKLKAERTAAADAYDAAMKQLEPVAAELKARGHSWYFLGKPQIIAPIGKKDQAPSLHFWLNGSGNPQPSGWYTLEELLAERFIADAKAEAAKRLAERSASRR